MGFLKGAHYLLSGVISSVSVAGNSSEAVHRQAQEKERATHLPDSEMVAAGHNELKCGCRIVPVNGRARS